MPPGLKAAHIWRVMSNSICRMPIFAQQDGEEGTNLFTTPQHMALDSTEDNLYFTMPQHYEVGQSHRM